MGKRGYINYLSANVKSCLKEECHEKNLRELYVKSLFMKDNDEIKKVAQELSQIYFDDNLTCEQYMAVVGANHLDLIDNILFVKLMELNYRQLHIKSVQDQNKKDELMKKLVLGYKRHYGNK